MSGMKDRHQAPSYPLRLPPELKAKVEESAEAQGRSLNAEIIARLQDSFTAGGQDKREELVKLLNEVIDQRLSGNVTLPAFTLSATAGPEKKARPK